VKNLLVILGMPLNGVPNPWEHFDVPAIMLNAYEIIKRAGLRKKIRKEGGLHNFLNYNGKIFLDSGGYQAMKNKITINLDVLKKVYHTVKADYYFSLDYPSLNVVYDIEKIRLTISNYLELRKYFNNLIPVIHPPQYRAIEEFETYRKHDSKYIAIGGLVPLMLTSKGISNGRKRAIDLIAEIRSKHKSKLHIMGLGAPTIIPIIKALNVSSTDSATWRIKAAHGKIMLPFGGERYVSKRGAKFGVVPLNEEEKNLIEKIKCPILNEFGWEGLQTSFQIRALFNAWVILNTPQNGFQLSGPFCKLLDYAKERADVKGIAKFRYYKDDDRKI